MLKSLKEHNKAHFIEFHKLRLTNIACPVCGEEVVETHPHMTLLTMPPQKEIHCPQCPWTGSCLI